MYHSVSTGSFSNSGHCSHYPAQSTIFTCAYSVISLFRYGTSSESTKFDSFKLNTALSNLRLKQSKIQLRFDIDLAVACINNIIETLIHGIKNIFLETGKIENKQS